MPQSIKFTFNNLNESINGFGSSAVLAPKKRVLTEVQISEIQEKSFSEGVLAGEQAALMLIEKRVEENIAQIITQYSDLQTDVDEQISLMRCQFVNLALVIAKKLSSALIDKYPLEEIEKLFLSCVQNLNAEPRIVIRVNESLIDLLKERIEGVAKKAGYAGRIVILGEPETLSAACRIEWADGGVSCRSEEHLEQIDRMVSEYVSATELGINKTITQTISD